MNGRYFTPPLLAANGILGAIAWQSPKVWVPAAIGIVLLGCRSIRPLSINEDGFERASERRMGPWTPNAAFARAARNRRSTMSENTFP